MKQQTIIEADPPKTNVKLKWAIKEIIGKGISNTRISNLLQPQEIARRASVEYLSGIAKYNEDRIIIDEYEVKFIVEFSEYVISNDYVCKYYKDGALHNTNGPAVIYVRGASYYCIDGNGLTEKQFNEL